MRIERQTNSMLNTNSEYLKPEIMDILRAFDAEEENFTHYFSYGMGKFFNSIEYLGEFYDFENECEVENDIVFKRLAKRFTKLAFYKILSSKKGNLPWGALTGIRPTKLAYSELAQGENFIKLFEEMYVSPQKITLTQSVINTQQGIYKKENKQDLFISIPFCPTKCDYCSFITAPITSTKQYVESYINCLIKEIYSIKPLVKNLNAVYIGGGSPFVLETQYLQRVFKAIKDNFPNIKEYTVEAGRPDTFTKEKLQLCKDYSITRLCVNPQSFNNATLQKICRKHTVEETLKAYEDAKNFNLDINIDLIAGLADEGIKEFEYSLDTAITLDPANITIHTLSLKSGAKLKENVKRLNIDCISQMVNLSFDKLTNAGYSPYYMYRQKYQAGGLENVGYTKQGKACIYNICVMEEISDNIAVGANAISKRLFAEEDRIERLASPKDIPTYMEKVDKIIEERSKLFNE